MTRYSLIGAMALMISAYLALGVIAPGQDPDTQLDIMGVAVALLTVALVLVIFAIARKDKA